MSAAGNPARTLFIWAIRGYQKFISPGLPRCCKFYPSCSQYAVDAISTFGIARGCVLAAWRLVRCNPLSYGGYDPVERQTVFDRGRRRSERSSAQGRPPAEAPTMTSRGGPACSHRLGRGSADTV